MNHKIAFVFPGQGSQEVGMGRELAAAYPVARQVFEQADQILGFPISKVAWEGPADELNDTINTQPALLVHSVAALAVLNERFPGLMPAFVAGHSMGELSALAAAGALPYPEALRLVRRRGELMKRAGEINPGRMAAMLGMDIPTLERICLEASAPGEIVQVANDNCPGQVVVSGNSQAIERAIALAQAAGARKIRPLAVSIAAHSPLMENAQIDFNLAVEAAPVAAPLVTVVGNVTARPLTNASEIRQDLQAQLTNRVRWTESIQWMVTQGVESFVEIGSGSVLGGLIKRINEGTPCLQVGAPADYDKLEGIF